MASLRDRSSTPHGTLPRGDVGRGYRFAAPATPEYVNDDDNATHLQNCVIAQTLFACCYLIASSLSIACGWANALCCDVLPSVCFVDNNLCVFVCVQVEQC